MEESRLSAVETSCIPVGQEPATDAVDNNKMHDVLYSPQDGIVDPGPQVDELDVPSRTDKLEKGVDAQIEFNNRMAEAGVRDREAIARLTAEVTQLTGDVTKLGERLTAQESILRSNTKMVDALDDELASLDERYKSLASLKTAKATRAVKPKNKTAAKSTKK